MFIHSVFETLTNYFITSICALIHVGKIHVKVIIHKTNSNEVSCKVNDVTRWRLHIAPLIFIGKSFFLELVAGYVTKKKALANERLPLVSIHWPSIFIFMIVWLLLYLHTEQAEERMSPLPEASHFPSVWCDIYPDEHLLDLTYSSHCMHSQDLLLDAEDYFIACWQKFPHSAGRWWVSVDERDQSICKYNSTILCHKLHVV